MEKLSMITEKIVNSPCYIFDEDILKGHIRELKEIVLQDARLCYAVKANPFLLKSLDNQIDAYEVCSPGELEICIQCGIAMDKVVFSGVNKGMYDIERAIACDVSVVTIESVLQLEMTAACAKKLNKKVNVLPRLSNGAQFGISDEELQSVIAHANEYENLNFSGIQYFTGTQKKKMDKVLEELDYIISYADMLREKYGFRAETIEFGPGLSVPYFEGDDFGKGNADFQILIEHIRKCSNEYQYVLELGRYIAASCGYYATKVVDTKNSGVRNYCIVDGGINHVNYYGQNMAMRVPIIEHIREAADTCADIDKEEWTICGSLCTFADILVRKTSFHGLKVGDMLVFKNIGAYSVTEGIYLFLSRKIPAIYLYSKEKGMRLIRPETDTASLNVAR